MSWDGGQSLLDKQHAADKVCELKRRMSEVYDDDIDTGRVSPCFICLHVISLAFQFYSSLAVVIMCCL